MGLDESPMDTTPSPSAEVIVERDLFDETFETLHQALGKAVHNRDWLHTWRQDIAALQEAKRGYSTALQRVLGSDELTETGKLRGYDRHLDQLTRRATRRDTPSDLVRVLDYLRGQELRAEIRKLDPIELRAEYESRLQDTSGRYDAWLRAVEESPISPRHDILYTGAHGSRPYADTSCRCLESPPKTLVFARPKHTHQKCIILPYDM
jgi:hypothetical protein